MGKSSRGPSQFRDPWNAGMVVAVVAVLIFAGYAAAKSLTTDSTPDYVSTYQPPVAEAPPTIGGFVRPEGDLQVLWVGDSLTAGAFSSVPETAFRPQVNSALSAGGAMTDLRVGDSGQGTPEILPQVEAASGQFGLAIVETGTNDFSLSNIQAFRTDYPALIAATKAKSPDGYLVCVGIWRDVNVASPFDRVIRQACSDNGGRYIQIADLYSNNENRGPAGVVVTNGSITDDFHPNDRGHAQIANRIKAVLAV